MWVKGYFRLKVLAYDAVSSLNAILLLSCYGNLGAYEEPFMPLPFILKSAALLVFLDVSESITVESLSVHGKWTRNFLVWL